MHNFTFRIAYIHNNNGQPRSGAIEYYKSFVPVL